MRLAESLQSPVRHGQENKTRQPMCGQQRIVSKVLNEVQVPEL